MINHKLVKFIKEARKKGFDDIVIKKELLKKRWPVNFIEDAFAMIKPQHKFKNQINIFLDSDLMKVIEKRAKKNMLNIHEQIEDILRRSCIRSLNKTPSSDKIDDKLVAIFSRKIRPKKKK